MDSGTAGSSKGGGERPPLSVAINTLAMIPPCSHQQKERTQGEDRGSSWDVPGRKGKEKQDSSFHPHNHHHRCLPASTSSFQGRKKRMNQTFSSWKKRNHGQSHRCRHHHRLFGVVRHRDEKGSSEWLLSRVSRSRPVRLLPSPRRWPSPQSLRGNEGHHGQREKKRKQTTHIESFLSQ